MLDIIKTLTWRDLVDILFLSLVAYQLFTWFRGTKALRVLIGLVVLGGVYSGAKFWGLFMTTWVFQILWQVLVILLLILFQAEIRQVLEKVSPLRFLRPRRHYSEADVIDDLARSAFDLARDRIGAIIVWAREDDPAEFIRAGQPVMALPTSALIKSIFNPQSPAHDGAVVISGGRLTEMGCFLPLTDREDLPEKFGTRHRAAVGLCEKADSVCLVVSEERGEVTTAVGGEIKTWGSPEVLAARLKEWLGVEQPAGPTLRGFLRGAFIENWGAKIGALVLVALAWLVLASAQTISTTVSVPIHYANIPVGLQLDPNTIRQVKMEVSGPRRRLVSLKPTEVKVHVNLQGLASGSHLVRFTSQDVELPLGLTINRVYPQNIEIRLQPEQTGTSSPKGPLPVRPQGD